MKLFLSALFILYCFKCTLAETESECKKEDYVCVPTNPTDVTASTPQASSTGTTKGVCRKEDYICVPSKPGQKNKTVTTSRATNSNKVTTVRAVTKWWQKKFWKPDWVTDR